ncbi:MAG TPA: hypothetical protein VK421_09505 [Pyrinomonadaceae bacterium]|nr:hypothetical protein [Pyrinomonadaceae bacterium]
MKHHPRPFALATSALLLSLSLLAPPAVRAQTVRQAAANLGGPSALANGATHARRRRIVAPRVAETPDGTRVTVAADAPLGDYSTSRDSELFRVLIPQSETALNGDGALRGRGFDDARVEAEGDAVRLSFRPAPDVTVRVTQGFNRLDLLFAPRAAQTSPATAPVSPLPAALLSSAPAASPTPAALPDAERGAAELLLRRVTELEARVRELESRQNGATAAHTAPDAATATTSHTETAAAAPRGTNARASNDPHAGHGDAGVAAATQDNGVHDEHTGPPRLQIQGFADLGFRATNEPGRTSSFGLGQLDLFLTSRLSEKFSVLGELIVEAGEDNAFNFEIHRLLLRYQHSDHLALSAGRYHTAIGYFNTAYHHGAWFQTAANRPLIYAFESKGGILPLHNVGLSAQGRVPRAPWGLRYVVELGNGRAARSPQDRAVQTSVDENNGKAFNVALFARPRQVQGLQAGFSVYRDRLTPRDAPNVGQTITAAHLVYQNSLYELLNEAVLLRHSTEARTSHALGLYTQFSRRFGRSRPYFRYQHLNVPEGFPLFPNAGRRNGPSLGLRYDVSDYAALKLQYDRTWRRRLTTLDELIMQLAFTF